MEFKGTKGKWHIMNRKSSFETHIVTDKHRICAVKHFDDKIDELLIDPTEKEGKYNALLISKVPEMLEMLKRLIKLVSDIDGTLFHHNHSVDGWHLNGDLEPMMNFVSEMDMEAVSEAEQLIKDATEL